MDPHARIAKIGLRKENPQMRRAEEGGGESEGGKMAKEKKENKSRRNCEEIAKEKRKK